jgi:hypothetical protein
MLNPARAPVAAAAPASAASAAEAVGLQLGDAGVQCSDLSRRVTAAAAHVPIASAAPATTAAAAAVTAWLRSSS